MGIKFIYDNRNSSSALSGQVKPVRILLNEAFRPSEGQTVITIQGEYKPGRGELEVLLNGIPQRSDIDYYEISSNMIQFIEPLEDEDVVQCIIRGAFVVHNRQQYTLERDSQILVLDTPYHVGGDSLMVFINGEIAEIDDDYFEEDEYTIRFENEYPAGTKIVVHEVR